MTKTLAFGLCALLAAACSRNHGKAEADPLPSDSCPHLQIKAPDSVSAGRPAAIEVDTIASQSNTAPASAGAAAPELRWTVSAGRITDGQGTANITVDTSGLNGQSIVASVQVAGLPRECATTTAQATTLVGP